MPFRSRSARTLGGLRGFMPGPVGVGEVPWAPTDIAGLQLWLKADAGTFQDAAMTTPASNDGDVVGGWEDQSGNGNHATQANAARKPTLRLNVQNGQPTVRWDGVDDALNNAGYPAHTEITVFFAFRSPLTTGIIWAQHNNPFNPFGVFATYRWYVRDILNNPLNSIDINPLPDANWVLYGAVYSDTTKNGELWKNGVSQGVDVLIGNLAVTGAGYALGHRQNVSNTDADIGEVLVYDSVLSVANRQAVENYVNGRYAIW